MIGFALDPRLEAETHAVCDLPLCAVRLQNDARWPWLVLVPRREGLTEIEHLPAAARAGLVEEVVRAGAAVRALGAASGFDVAKLNVGALGNVVAQLHVHVIGRRPGDPAGSAPVWGVGVRESYPPEALQRAIEAARASLA